MNLFSECDIIESSETFSDPVIPGVYFLINQHDSIIYVGQSEDVYTRLRNHRRFMVRRGRVFNREHIIRVESEIERKILEVAYIKKFKPMFNSTYNDNKPIEDVIDRLKKSYMRKLGKQGKFDLMFRSIKDSFEGCECDSEKTTASQ